MSSGSNNIERFGVTPASYRITGLAVDKVRNIVGLQTIVFATPDVGGLALCCSRIRVLDIGLLTNRLLAKGGYNTVPAVFSDEKPDIIEVHEEWATYSQIYSLPVFKENYQAIIIDGTRLYLRRDHVQELLEDELANWCYIKDISCLTMAVETHRYVDHTFRSDDVAFLVNGRVLVVKSLPEIAHR